MICSIRYPLKYNDMPSVQNGLQVPHISSVLAPKPPPYSFLSWVILDSFELTLHNCYYSFKCVAFQHSLGVFMVCYFQGEQDLCASQSAQVYLISPTSQYKFSAERNWIQSVWLYPDKPHYHSLAPSSPIATCEPLLVTSSHSSLRLI